MIVNKDSVQLSDYCFNACEALKTTIEVRNADHLDEYARVALEDLGRYVDWPYTLGLVCSVLNPRITLEIERTLRRGASTPKVKYDKGKIEKYKSEIQDILDDLNRPSLSTNGDNDVCERATQSLSVGSSATAEPGGGSYLIMIYLAWNVDCSILQPLNA